MALQKTRNRTDANINARLRAIRKLSKTAPPITTNPERLGGTPVIGIQRMPVSQLIDYLIDGYTVEQFIEEFSMEPKQVYAALEKIKQALDEGWLAEKVTY